MRIFARWSHLQESLPWSSSTHLIVASKGGTEDKACLKYKKLQFLRTPEELIASWRDQEYIPQQFTLGESVGGDSPRKFDMEPTERIGQKEPISPPSHIIRQMAEQGRRASEPNISRFGKELKTIFKTFFSHELHHRNCRRRHDIDAQHGSMIKSEPRRRKHNSGVSQDPEADLVSIPEGEALDLTLAR